MMRLIRWLLPRDSDTNEEEERAQKRHINEVMARAEDRLNEQKRHTERAVADNPITYRVRARPAHQTGGRNVYEGR